MRDKQQLRLLGKLLRYTIVSYNFNSSTARSPFSGKTSWEPRPALNIRKHELHNSDKLQH